MSERVQYACDVCGVEKQDSNHWWQISIFKHGGGPLQLFPWKDRISPDSSAWASFHLCGHACVLRKVDEFMSPPPPPNRQEASTEARIQQQENREPAQPQWTEDGLMKQACD